MSIIADIIAKVVAAFLTWWSGERQRREAAIAREDLGAARAEANGLRAAEDRATEARQIEAEAKTAHSKDNTDDAFLGEFRRNG